MEVKTEIDVDSLTENLKNVGLSEKKGEVLLDDDEKQSVELLTLPEEMDAVRSQFEKLGDVWLGFHHITLCTASTSTAIPNVEELEEMLKAAKKEDEIIFGCNIVPTHHTSKAKKKTYYVLDGEIQPVILKLTPICIGFYEKIVFSN
jgi:hypothetical protein